MMEVGVKEASLLSALVGLLLYLNTLDCDLLADDEPAIKWNQDVRPSSPWKQLLLNDFWGTPLSSSSSHKSYRPLCVATFRLNYMLHGLQPMGYHLVNLLMHAVVCCLYVRLCALVFKQVWPALLAGLLFAAHPIHTEAVAGVVGRAELLSALLFLLSFQTYCKSLTSTTSGQTRWVLLSVSLGLSVLAMLSKEQGVTALALCLIYDLFIFNQKKSVMGVSKQSLLKSVSLRVRSSPANTGFFTRGVVVSAVGLVAIVTRLALSNGAPSKKIFTSTINPPLGQESPYRQLSWLNLVSVNLWLLLSPSKLSADWRYNAVPLVESIWDWKNVSTVLGVSSLVGLLLFALQDRGRGGKIVLFGISLMVFPFLPASNLLFPVGFVVAERVLYLPSMGFCMLVAYGLWSLSIRLSSRQQTLRILLGTFVGVLLCTHAAKTLSRNRVWHSTSSLQTAGVQFNPNNPILLSNLGIEHAIKEDYTHAELLYLTSMKQKPSYSGGYYNYGRLMKLMHRYQEAEEPLMKAIQLGAHDASNRTMAERYDLLATVISMNASRLNEALELSEYVLNQHPGYAHILNTRCAVLIKLDRTDQFIRACEMAVWRNQRVPDAHFNLGMAYSKLGYLQQAEMAYRNMLLVAQGSAVAMHHLAKTLQALGNMQQLLEARQLWKELVHRAPADVEALLSLAVVDSSLHHYTQAMDSLDTVLSLDPDNREALYRSGQLLYQRQFYQEAISLLSRLVELEPSGYRDSRRLLHKARSTNITYEHD